MNIILKYQKYFIAIILVLITMLGFEIRIDNYNTWIENKNYFFVNNQPTLVNADGFYYLRLARDIQNKQYHKIDEKRIVGDKAKRPLPPPLLSTLTAFFSDVLSISLENVAIFIPSILASLIAIVLYLLARSLTIEVIPALIASLLSVLSLAFVIRTSLGFYDTDSLNLIFPLLETYFFLRFAQEKSIKRYYFLIGGLLSFLLFLLWWEQAIAVVLITFIVPLFFSLCFYYKQPTRPKILFAILVAFVIVFITLIITSNISILGNINSLLNDIVFNNKEAIFPNIATGVIETQPITWSGISEASFNNIILFYLAIVGFIILLITRAKFSIFLIVPLCLAFLPLYLGYRFVMFSEIIIAIGFAFFVQCCWWLLNKKEFKIILGIAIVGFMLFLSNNLYNIHKKHLEGVRTRTPEFSGCVSSSLE